MRKSGFTTFAYLDDYAGCSASHQEALNAYHHFLNLAEHLGLALASKKCQPPAQKVTWLGYSVNTVKMEVSIPQEKIHELRTECQAWIARTKANKRMLQSLIGKIIHAAGCIRHARKFTSRLLATLRSMDNKNWTTLTADCKADIRWFLEYASVANGLSLYAPTLNFLIIECDACLSGAGGNTDSHYYEWKYAPHHLTRFPTIHQLEAVNVLVAIKTLAPPRLEDFDGVLIFTDNISASFSLESGKTRDKVLGACARELWLMGALMDAEIQIKHKPGHLIPLADALSRACTDPAMRHYVNTEVRRRGLFRLPPALCGYKFFDDSL